MSARSGCGSRAGARLPPPFLIATGGGRRCRRTSRGSNTRSPPTRSSTCPSSRSGSWWSAAAISRWSSPRSSRGSAPQMTQVMRGANVLRGFDDDMRAGVRDAMRARASTSASARCRRGSRSAATGRSRRRSPTAKTVEADRSCSPPAAAPTRRGSVSRRWASRLTPRGAIVVDECRTSSIPWLHAVGDVTDHINLTPVAIREGHALADRLSANARADRYDTAASVVFATPEIGAVGLTEAEARARLATVDVYQANFRPLKATLRAAASGRS